jgi:hypothetical protein
MMFAKKIRERYSGVGKAMDEKLWRRKRCLGLRCLGERCLGKIFGKDMFQKKPVR